MSQKVKIVALLKAKDQMTKEEIKEHWLNVHAKITGSYKNMKGYRINLPLDEFKEAHNGLPYDGTAELWWDSIEDMNEDFTSETGTAAGKDGELWIQSCISIFTEEFIVK